MIAAIATVSWAQEMAAYTLLAGVMIAMWIAGAPKSRPRK